MEFRSYYLTSWEIHFEESQNDSFSLSKQQVVPYHSLVCSVLLGFSLLDKRWYLSQGHLTEELWQGTRTQCSRDIFWGKMTGYVRHMFSNYCFELFFFFLISQKNHTSSATSRLEKEQAEGYTIKWSPHNRACIFLGFPVAVLWDAFWNNYNIPKSFLRLELQSHHHFHVAGAGQAVHWRLTFQDLALALPIAFRNLVHLFRENVIFLTSFSVFQKGVKAVFWAGNVLVIYDVKKPTKKIFMCG